MNSRLQKTKFLLTLIKGKVGLNKHLTAPDYCVVEHAISQLDKHDTSLVIDLLKQYQFLADGYHSYIIKLLQLESFEYSLPDQITDQRAIFSVSLCNVGNYFERCGELKFCVKALESDFKIYSIKSYAEITKNDLNTLTLGYLTANQTSNTMLTFHTQLFQLIENAEYLPRIFDSSFQYSDWEEETFFEQLHGALNNYSQISIPVEDYDLTNDDKSPTELLGYTVSIDKKLRLNNDNASLTRISVPKFASVLNEYLEYRPCFFSPEFLYDVHRNEIKQFVNNVEVVDAKYNYSTMNH